MSETLLGAIIGATASFFGVLLALFVNSVIEAQRLKQERIKDLRIRLIGSRTTAKEVVEYIKNIKGQKKRFFRGEINKKRVGNITVGKQQIEDEIHRPDLSWAQLKGLNLRWQDLSTAIMIHADLEEADFLEANLTLSTEPERKSP